MQLPEPDPSTVVDQETPYLNPLMTTYRAQLSKVSNAVVFPLMLVLGGCASNSKPAPEAMPKLESAGPFQCENMGPLAYLPGQRLPVFPKVARSAKQDGWVILEYDVVGGRAANIHVLASSPKGLFEDFAIATVESTYFPSQKDGKNCKRPFVFNNKD